MAIGKWIGGALGWVLAGGSVLGAIAGYCVGSMLDDAFNASDEGKGFGEGGTTIQTRISINAHSRKTATRSSFQCLCSRLTS